MSSSEAKVEKQGNTLPPPARRRTITTRCKQVLIQRARGFSNKEVGHALGTSDKTVSNQVSAVSRLFRTHSALQASLTAVELGLINPGEIIRERGIENPEEVINSLLPGERRVLSSMTANRGVQSTYQEVGNSLGISPCTVRNHLASIYRKIGYGDKVFAAMLFLAAGKSRLLETEVNKLEKSA